MLTVNQIYKDLISLIKTALQSNGLNWQVIQAYQQTMGNFEPPYVMLHRLTTTNYGFQYGKDYTTTVGQTKQHKYSENQIEIQSYQIEAKYHRTPTDNYATITGADVVRLLARWFMSEVGIAKLREKGYGILRITDVAEEYYKDVHDIYQVNPHFRMDIVALQSDESPSNIIADFDGKIKEVEQLKYEEEE